MHESDIGALLVRGHDGDVGIITERDIVRALAEDEWAWAVDCMTRDLIVVPAAMSIGDAADVLITAGVRHLVVEQEDGTIGVASMRDLIAPLLDSTS
ncbi:MAG: CBS domain-containing protein [Actinobacteria bacterium]|nr:CBS domain-containing protein [Actinomycetota bacterium]NIS36559.1 CBS domain-containing protein [Actinomycetota bacterium]NIT98778.1 CBS domain-containing protein [Actinomycetota bacterium]NIU22403.1 CBS domain-containing protein [Actinomycetota bacterium]NIU71067.1 CBS domain-containing protein [Actinomycetota bacterium]